MSETVDLFVRTDQSIQEFVHDLGSLLDMQFTLVRDQGNDSYYEYCSEEIRVGVTSTWGFENDRDLHFEDYQYYIAILYVGRVGDVEEFRRVRNEFARFAFERLKTTERYALLMTFDVQRKLAEYEPQLMPRPAVTHSDV
jgi:hypothetical protein